MGTAPTGNVATNWLDLEIEEGAQWAHSERPANSQRAVIAQYYVHSALSVISQIQTHSGVVYFLVVWKNVQLQLQLCNLCLLLLWLLAFAFVFFLVVDGGCLLLFVFVCCFVVSQWPQRGLTLVQGLFDIRTGTWGGALGVPHCPPRTLKRQGMDVLNAQGPHKLSIPVLLWFIIFGEIRHNFFSW